MIGTCQGLRIVVSQEDGFVTVSFYVEVHAIDGPATGFTYAP